MIQQILFIVAALAAGFIFYKRIAFIRRSILMGKKYDPGTSAGQRFRKMTLFALGQKKMFQRPFPAFFHGLIYIGFIIINIEILEIILDGVLGTHRLFAAPLGSVYGVLIGLFEVLAALVILACVVFLIRRNFNAVMRFKNREMKGWPTLDGNLILIVEIALMIAFLKMNMADWQLQQLGTEHYVKTTEFWISGPLSELIYGGLGQNMLMIIERGAWWFHILGVMGFAIYITYSKHLHVFLAFPNTYYGSDRKSGEMVNMPEITREVNMMLNPDAVPADQQDMPPPSSFGAKDVTDLTWKNLLDAYSCTECGRCTSSCPANITGKKLSPRKIMMDTRDRAEELTRFRQKNGAEASDEKSLLHDYISVEELNACTTCQACVMECPVNIDPLNIIQSLRRNLIMEESNSPQEWNLMFNNIENNFAPWQFSPEDRLKWKDEANG